MKNSHKMSQTKSHVFLNNKCFLNNNETPTLYQDGHFRKLRKIVHEMSDTLL